MASVIQRDGGAAGRSAWAPLVPILAAGLCLRVAAAGVVQWYAQRVGKPCLFGDTAIYWELARAIRAGGPFRVDQWGVPHFALRTPGYPLFLAACQALFGERYVPVRLVQAALGTIGVYFLYRLVMCVAADRSVALLAAGIAAVEPYGVGMGALILSEGVFVPLMLAALWGTATLWSAERPRRPIVVGLLTGAVHGAAILARPSWALIVPALLACPAIFAGRGRRAAAARDAAIVALATALVMMPWWARNYRVFGRFVPTAVWVGPSLYDGLSPTATGASDMRFLEEPDVIGLDEESQDRELRDRAIDFARAHPGRAIELALIKAARFWSPWPNAETLRSPAAAWASAVVTIPLFTLLAIGVWDRRGDPRALVLLLGPLIYFLALHMVFVSSIRYRIPGFVPAIGLAAIGWARLRRARSRLL